MGDLKGSESTSTSSRCLCRVELTELGWAGLLPIKQVCGPPSPRLPHLPFRRQALTRACCIGLLQASLAHFPLGAFAPSFPLLSASLVKDPLTSQETLSKSFLNQWCPAERRPSFSVFSLPLEPGFLAAVEAPFLSCQLALVPLSASLSPWCFTRQHVLRADGWDSR